MDFGVAEKFGGTCNLRFDDTNPVKEDVEYVDSIKEDIKWLGFDWEDREYYASDYFPQLYDLAIRLIKEDKAYVDELTAEQIAELNKISKSIGLLLKEGKKAEARRLMAEIQKLERTLPEGTR